MKKIFLLILIVISGSVFSKEISFRDSFLLNTQHLQKINLHMPAYHDNDEARQIGICFFVAGIALTTASILEGGYQYGTYQTNPNNPSQQIYVVPPFWKQTPRQIMLCVGIGFTIGGGIATIKN